MCTEFEDTLQRELKPSQSILSTPNPIDHDDVTLARNNDSTFNFNQNAINVIHSPSNIFSNTKFVKNLQQMMKLLLTAKCYCVLIYEGD